MFGDEGPKDWEWKEEEPPEALKKKWEQEEASSQKVICPSCAKETPAENLTCVFCQAVILPEFCPIACALNWVKRLFKRPK